MLKLTEERRKNLAFLRAYYVQTLAEDSQDGSDFDAAVLDALTPEGVAGEEQSCGHPYSYRAQEENGEDSYCALCVIEELDEEIEGLQKKVKELDEEALRALNERDDAGRKFLALNGVVFKGLCRTKLLYTTAEDGENCTRVTTPEADVECLVEAIFQLRRENEALRNPTKKYEHLGGPDE